MKAVSVLGIGFILVLAFRLIDLQLWAGDAYSARARRQHDKHIVLQASRGRILDRNGRVLATNLASQSFFVNNVSDLDNLRQIAVRFSRRAGESESEMLQRLREKRSFVWLARKVMNGPPEDQIPEGVGQMVEMRRTYPMGSLAGQILGYTNIDNVGIEGVELTYDRLLRGVPGEMVSRVDARGKTLGALGEVLKMPEDGADVMLTIDADYQSIAEEELEATVQSFHAHSGIAIVMVPSTGEILAMANCPLYDPNHASRYKPGVRRDRAVTDQYEPGSTFKVVSVSAALDQHVVQPDERFFCENGIWSWAGGTIRDAHPSGWLTVRQVVEVSSNIGAAKVAQKLGAAKLYRYIRLFGFGSPTGVGLAGEISGEVERPPEWSKRSLETIAIGQEVGVTALQMATACAAVANGGRLMVPRIFRKAVRGDSVVAETHPEEVRQVVSPQTAATMRSFMEGVVERGTGTNAQVPGYRVGGKTGTAQRAYDNAPGYDPNRYVSSFVGFLPVDHPKLLCLVVVDSPQGIHWGSQVAAPVFRRIMERILSLRSTKLRQEATGEPKPGPFEGPAPVLVGLSRAEAERTAARYGLSPKVVGNGDRVVRQKIESKGDGKVAMLYVAPTDSAQDSGKVVVPDVVGVPLRQAVTQLTAAGLHVQTTGSGWVVEQTPRAGTAIVRGTVCNVVCRTKE